MTDRIEIRPLIENDIPEADRIMRLAFGTFLGLEDPSAHMGDADYVRSRWTASPEAAFAAEMDGKLIGSNFATRWGSFAFFGPLTVDPALQDQGIGGWLVEPVIELFDTWGVTQTGLFTFADSPKHIGLYQKFGFRPRAPTVIMERTVGKTARNGPHWTTFSRLGDPDRVRALDACRGITNQIYPGLDANGEVQSLEAQSHGDTVLLGSGELLGFAACHTGSGSEAGSGVCYIKFGAVAPGVIAETHFRDLLRTTEEFAASRGAERVVAGVNTARVEAYQAMLSEGFGVSRSGVAMHRPNESGFSKPGVFVIDDWR